MNLGILSLIGYFDFNSNKVLGVILDRIPALLTMFRGFRTALLSAFLTLIFLDPDSSNTV